jgi:hypothetical protein
LTEAASFDGMSKQEKMDWFQETNANIARAWAWMQEHGKYIVNAGTQSQSNLDLNNVYGYNYDDKGPGGEVPGSEANTIKRL